MLAWWNADLEITELVIADFGLASSRPDRIAYTPGFKAPEIHDNEHEDAPSPDKTTDIWALGMSLIEFLTKNTWAYTYEEDDIPWKIVDQTGYHDQILSMLNHTPSERLKLDEPILTFPERDWSSLVDVSYKLFGEYLYLPVSTATFVQAVDIFCRFKNIAKDRNSFRSSLTIASKWGELTPLSYYNSNEKKIEREILENLNGLVFIPGLEGLISNLEKIPQRQRKKVWDQFVPDPIAFNEVVRNFKESSAVSNKQ
jgi:serine/threonine protein kinase